LRALSAGSEAEGAVDGNSSMATAGLMTRSSPWNSSVTTPSSGF